MAACKHCGKTLLSQQHEFCCNGCATAYKLISNLHLGQYYEYYSKLLGKSPAAAEQFDNQLDYISSISSTDEEHSISLIVNGLHCGACVWLIEHILHKQAEVLSARVNLSTKRLHLTWHGPKENINDYVGLIQQAGYNIIPYDPSIYEEKSAEARMQMFKCLAVAGFGFLQVMMVAVAVWAGHWNAESGAHTQHMLHIITALISIPCILYSIRPFIKSARASLSCGRANMDVAIVLSVFFTLLFSVIEAIHNHAYTYFDSVSMLLFFLLIGRYIDLKIRDGVSAQATKLLLSQPQTVLVERGDKLLLIHISNAVIGDIARVAVGEKIALDGVIIEGESTLDSSIITGETLPKPIQVNDVVYAGSINISYPFRMRIEKLSNDSLLVEIVRLIESASQYKNKFVLLADKISGIYTPLVFALSTCTFLYWYYVAHCNVNIAGLRAVAVLLVTCPCALALAVPAVYIIATSKLITRGILLRNSDALERLVHITKVCLDKTGTITYGCPSWLNKADFSQKELSLLLSLSQISKHPLCVALRKSLHNSSTLDIENAEEISGQGVQCLLEQTLVKLGSRSFTQIKSALEDNYMEMWLNYDNIQKRLIFQDEIRTDSTQAIAKFQQLNLEIALLSGDRPQIVANVAAEVGIKTCYGALLPTNKYELVEAYQAQGHKVLMLGDGLNDAAVMKLAHCSMSPSSAIDLTQTIADVIYPGNINAVVYTIEIARHAQQLVKQNLALSLSYNALIVPFAMAGAITPVVAALFMSISSITVVLNALRLNK